MLSCRMVLFCLTLTCLTSAAVAEKPIWAKHAIPIGECNPKTLRTHQIPAPYSNSLVELRCHPPEKDSNPIPYFHIRTASGNWHDIEMDEGGKELLWSPDSNAFLLNGGTSGYAGFFTTVYILENDAVHRVEITKAAQADMVKTFPPCKALNRDEGSARP